MADRENIAVWDACVIISAIQQASDHWPDAEKDRWTEIEPFVRDAERGDFKIVVPESVVAEVTSLKGLDSANVPIEKQVRMIQDFLENPYIVRRPIHRGISEMAAEISRKHGVKAVGDSLILATAVVWDVSLIHTYDGAGKRSRGRLLDLDGCLTLRDGTTPIEISKPNYGKGTLFDAERRP